MVEKEKLLSKKMNKKKENFCSVSILERSSMAVHISVTVIFHFLMDHIQCCRICCFRVCLRNILTSSWKHGMQDDSIQIDWREKPHFWEVNKRKWNFYLYFTKDICNGSIGKQRISILYKTIRTPCDQGFTVEGLLVLYYCSVLMAGFYYSS
jgi:hypothetical protein